MHNRISAFIILFLVILLSGCRTPDIRPFADATSTLNASVQVGGERIKRTFNKADAEAATGFEESWKLRKAAVRALQTYSTSLAGIAEAGKYGKENTARLVGAVSNLATALGGNVVAQGTGALITFVGHKAIEVKAYRDMGKAVNAANPVVVVVADALSRDLGALQTLHQQRLKNFLRKNKTRRVPLQRYYDAIHGQQIRQRNLVVSTGNDASAVKRMIELDHLAGAAKAELDEMMAEAQAFREQLETGQAFFTAGRQAVSAWAAAHANLYRTFTEKAALDMGELVARAKELQLLIENLED